MNRPPLADIRILDFSWVGAGPFTTKILSDFGAEVVKIESHRRPDQLRKAEPLTGQRTLEESGYFANRNVNKKSIAIDLKHPEAGPVVLALAARSDVVINSFSPGVMERFGLGYEEIRAVRDDVIYVSMPFGGDSGPYRDFLGYGMNIAALVGLLALGGLPGRWPVGTGTNYPDHLPNPLHAAFAILTALAERRRSGRGQIITLSQIDSTLAMVPDDILDYAANSRLPEPGHLDDPEAGPHGLYPCQGEDRWCAISVRGDAQFAALACAMGEPALACDPRFASLSARRSHQAELDARVSAWTALREPRAVMEELQFLGIAAGIVQTPDDLLVRDPQLEARGFWQYLDHPVMQRSVYHGVPACISGLSNRYATPAPLLGQHNAELPHLTGLSPDVIAGLTARGVFQ
ncbi:benzylsuccinate CoA-transferase BbsF subunit [Rhodoligotrophos appendicifer]|uniref:CaiB/BaiF CoA transferase family protein n=1 Tax=Rhodoligotrophos appendicifer TaxID=987056 RepID=UPI001184D8BB|nr:CoA transferase [Rhodoligotrophos appendicifer]